MAPLVFSRTCRAIAIAIDTMLLPLRVFRFMPARLLHAMRIRAAFVIDAASPLCRYAIAAAMPR